MSASAIATGAGPSVRDEWRRGYKVVVSAHVGMATGAGLYFYASSLFVIPLSETFGWSRGDIALGTALGLLGSLTAPLIGRLTDRFGARIVAGLCAIIAGAVFAVMSQMTGPFAQYVALSAVFGLVAPGVMAMTFSRAVTGWFKRARGQALGVMAAGNSIGALLFTPVIAFMLAQYGPEGGYLTLTALTALLGGPVILAGLRERDGISHEDGGVEERDADAPADRGRIFATLRSRSFIALALAVFATNVPVAGVLTQLEPLLLHNGVTQTAPLVSMYAIVVLLGRLGVGWLFDRTDARYVAAGVTILAATGCLLFLSGAPAWGVIAAIVLVGLMQGMEVDAIGYFVARQFGRGEFGLIFGILLTASLLGTAIGILGFGMLYDATQSYDLALMLAAGVIAIAFVGYLAIPRTGEQAANDT